MEKKIKKIPFNLELAKAIMTGVKEGRVITRNGEIVESLTLKISYNNCFIVGDILCPDGRNLNFKYLMNGMISDETESCFDLFLEVPGVLEFKKGDVVFQKHERCSWLSLLKDNVEYGQEIFTHDYVDMYVTGDNKGLIEYDSYSDAAEEIRLATPEEKQMLIDALKKDGSDKAVEYLKYLCDDNDSISKRVLSNLEEIGKNLNTPATPDSCIDYERLRVELAKIYSVELAKIQFSSSGGFVFSEIAKKSVEYADTVIEELKKKEIEK